MTKILKKIKRKLAEEDGASMTIMNIGILVIVFVVIVIISTLVLITTLFIQSRNLVEEATVSLIQNNYANVYHTSRESYSGGYVPNSTSFSESFTENNEVIYNTLIDNMGFEKIGTKYARVSKNGEVLYYIKDISIEITNENIGSGRQNFIGNTEYKFVFPINFLGYTKDLELKMVVKAKHTGKF